MPNAKISSKGQITIPHEIRTRLGFATGDTLDFFVTKDGDCLIQRSTGSIMDLHGILKRLGYVKEGEILSIEEMDNAIAEHVCEMDRATMSDVYVAEVALQEADKVA